MKKFFRSSFFVLTVIALLASVSGAFLAATIDTPPKSRLNSAFKNFLGSVILGPMPVFFGLIPYWIFHAVIGDITFSWAEIENKLRRVIWVILWAGFLGWAFMSFIMGIAGIA